jgi:predicted nucleic acid-binding protein
MRILLDTHVFIWGYLHSPSPSIQLLTLLRNQPEKYTILFSEELLEQLCRVGRRVGGKDWVGGILSRIWQDFAIQMVEIDVADLYRIQQDFPDIPAEDVGVFLTAKLGQADVLVSNNRKFVRAAAAAQHLFACLTVEEFLSQFSPPH